MAAINLPKFYSQWDGDNGGAKGACGETCLKMIDHHLTGREIAISDIIKNGDNNPAITSTDGMKKAADWLGFGVDYYYDARESDIKRWLSEGKLIVAVLKYGLFPAKYKQDQKYQSGHFVVITGMTDDGKAIRFADPNFWGDRREEGWMDNNKWASYGDFYLAFYHNDGAICRNGTVLVCKKGKLPTPPASVPDPCANVKQDLEVKSRALDAARELVYSLESQRAILTEQNKKLTEEAGQLRDHVVSMDGQLKVLTGERDRFQKSLVIAEAQLGQKDTAIGRLEGQVEGLTGELQQRDGEIVGLQQTIKELELNMADKLTTGQLVGLLLKRFMR